MRIPNYKKLSITATVGVLLVIVLFLIFKSGIASKTPEVTIAADNCYAETLTVLTDDDYSPYSFYDEKGNYSGHDVELIIMIANEMGVNLDLRLMNWYEAIDAINAKEADVLMTCDYSDTFEGVDRLIKCEPVSFDDFIVYSKHRIASSDEIYGKRIAIMKNGNVSAQINMMNLKSYCVEYSNNRMAMQALINDEVDFAIMRQTVGTVLLKELNARGIEGYVGIGQSFMCFGVAGENKELADRINLAIEQLKKNGEMNRLHNKWLTTFVRPYSFREVVQNNFWVFAVFVILIIMAAGSFIISLLRKRKGEKEQHIKDQEQQKQLQIAYDRVNAANLRNDFIQDIIHSGKWTFFLDANDEFTGSDVSAEANSILRNEVPADGRSWLNIVHPDDKEHAAEAFWAAIRDHSCRTPYDVNYRMIGRDGKYRWFHSAGRMIRNEDGSGEFFGIHVDITERMEEQQKRLLGAIPLSSDVLYKANIGLWAFELDEGQAPRMYGDETMLGLVGLEHQVTPEEMYHAWYDHIDADSYELVTDAVAKMSSGEHAEVQYPWHHPDGHIMIVRCGGVRNFEYKKGVRIEGTHQDVSATLHFDEEERKREEQQRKDEIARIEAESSNKAKTEFLFNMSHDIRTPMNAILGYTDIALNHVSEPAKVGDSLKKIKMSGGHLLNLINDILEMSRIEASKLDIVKAPLCISEVTESIKVMSQALASSRDITFSTVFGDIRNPYVYADELHTNQIIINLISNAIKYTNPGGRVDYYIDQITAPEEGIARYRITVSDNGIGMTEEFQKHLFESFSREKSAAVSKQEGTGLGLAIVKRIVDIIGGTIQVQSQKDVGSTFVVELPLEVMDDAAIEEFKAAHKGGVEMTADLKLEGKIVLLVEDNEMNREIATELLEESGMKIETAEDGSVAVGKVKEKGADYYDFILMDIQMPVMNGYEATAQIRKLPEGDRIPIIALSANAFKEDIDKSLASGMNAHVAKPINVKELFSALAKFMKN